MIKELVRKKPILTFARRERRFEADREANFNSLWLKYGLDSSSSLPLNLHDIFTNKGAFVLEIGFGHGEALFELAKNFPEKNFIGIEVYKTGIERLLVNAAKADLKNIRVFSTDAREIMATIIPDKSISEVKIFFPDPWPKRRHHKRRLIQKDFVELIAKKLANNGLIHFVTDWQDYATEAHKILAANPSICEVDISTTTLPRHITKFAKRACKANRKIHELLFKKIAI